MDTTRLTGRRPWWIAVASAVAGYAAREAATGFWSTRMAGVHGASVAVYSIIMGALLFGAIWLVALVSPSSFDRFLFHLSTNNTVS
jgi:hypothetical protein